MTKIAETRYNCGFSFSVLGSSGLARNARLMRIIFRDP